MRELKKKRMGIVVLGVLAVVVGFAMGFDPTDDAAVLMRAAIAWT